MDVEVTTIKEDTESLSLSLHTTQVIPAIHGHRQVTVIQSWSYPASHLLILRKNYWRTVFLLELAFWKSEHLSTLLLFLNNTAEEKMQKEQMQSWEAKRSISTWSSKRGVRMRWAVRPFFAGSLGKDHRACPGTPGTSQGSHWTATSGYKTAVPFCPLFCPTRRIYGLRWEVVGGYPTSEQGRLNHTALTPGMLITGWLSIQPGSLALPHPGYFLKTPLRGSGWPLFDLWSLFLLLGGSALK